MRAKFDEQLNMLNQEMMHMGSMIEDSIQTAIASLVHQDIVISFTIMERDEEIVREHK